jgi:hypothetical protein
MGRIVESFEGFVQNFNSEKSYLKYLTLYPISKVNVKNDEILVSYTNIQKLFSEFFQDVTIRDGRDLIQYRNCDVQFMDDDEGYIPLETYNKIGSILDSYVENGQLYNYSIETSRNTINLDFDLDGYEDFSIGIE